MSRRQIKRAMGDEFLVNPLAGIVAEYAETPEKERFDELLKHLIASQEHIGILTTTGERYKVALSRSDEATFVMMQFYAGKGRELPCRLFEWPEQMHASTRHGEFTRTATNSTGFAVLPADTVFLSTIEDVLLARIDAEPRKS